MFVFLLNIVLTGQTKIASYHQQENDHYMMCISWHWERIWYFLLFRSQLLYSRSWRRLFGLAGRQGKGENMIMMRIMMRMINAMRIMKMIRMRRISMRISMRMRMTMGIIIMIRMRRVRMRWCWEVGGRWWVWCLLTYRQCFFVCQRINILKLIFQGGVCWLHSVQR